MNYLMIILIALAVILLSKFLFHVDGSKLVALIVNAIIVIVLSVLLIISDCAKNITGYCTK